MPFLIKAARKEDPRPSSSDAEESYERMFPKIGRDFVHRKDFENIIRQILYLIDPLGINPISLDDDSEARKRALEYKQFLDDQRDGSEVYPDLINLDDEEEDDSTD